MQHAASTEAAFDALPSEAAILDRDGVLLVVNEAWRQYGRANGAGAGCGPGANYLAVCAAAAESGDEVAAVAASALTAVLEGHAPSASLDYPCHSPTAEQWFTLRVRTLPGQDRVVVLHDDITDRMREFSALRHGATHDPLTGLVNRALLRERLATALTTRDRRTPPATAVVVLDLDGFKRVNDEHGHLAGDALLAEMGARLARHGRPQDTVARWGGDEFVLVLPGCDLDQAERVAARVVATMALPVTLGAVHFRLDASTGIAVGAPGQDADAVLGAADAALRRAKRARYRTP